MAEIKSPYSDESIAQYAKEQNLDLLNSMQIASKFMELEEKNTILEDRLTWVEVYLKQLLKK